MPDGEYIGRSMPDFSKSILKTLFFFCPYLFYNTKILGEKQHTDKKCDVGTDTHIIFAEFWKYVDSEYIFNLKLNPSVPSEHDPLTSYFFGICRELTPEYDREVSVLARIFWKFAVLHAARFYYLWQLFNGNQLRIWNYFVPKMVENYYYAESIACHGTTDIGTLEVDERENEVEFVADYKTGGIPASALRGPKNLTNELSTELPTRFNFEIHVYGLLRAMELGCKFLDEKVIRFVLNNEYQDEDGWHDFGLGRTKREQQVLDKIKSVYLTNIQASLDIRNSRTRVWEKFDMSKILVGIIFLTGNPLIKYPVVVKKKFNPRSMRTVLLKISTARQVYFNRENNDYYLVRLMRTRPEYNKYICQNCSRNAKCLEEIEADIEAGL